MTERGLPGKGVSFDEVQMTKAEAEELDLERGSKVYVGTKE